jgi:large subunit ribosomal protein L18
MDKNKVKNKKRDRRRGRIRSRITGTGVCPRLSVFKSNKGMYVQLIDDQKGVTILSAHSKEIKKEMKKVDNSFELGKLVAKKAVDKKINKAVFDRGGYKYHGRIAKVAEGAREGGLKF